MVDLAILWQAVSALIFADRSPCSASAYAIDRPMIISCTSQTELDLPNQRVGISRTALVNRLIGRVISVVIRIIVIRVVKERMPKIAKEEEPIVEASMVEPIAAKATAKAATVKTASTGGAAAVKAAATKPAVKPSSSTEAAATKAAPVTTPATAVRHHV